MKINTLGRVVSISGLLLAAAACGGSDDAVVLITDDGQMNGAAGSDSSAGAAGTDSDGQAGSEDNASPATQTITGSITENTTWSADTVYTLDGLVFVESDAVLTVEAGTTILGNGGSALVVTQGSELVATGTAEAPIVFTSSQPEGDRSPNDWGGVVLLGSAPNNIEAPTIEGIDPAEDPTRIAYGGSEPDSSCGTLRYVRIEFAGFEFAGDNELNGLTVGACGRGTELDYIQVHMGSDDGIEFFGGTADLKHAVISGAEDDSLDWDQGWQGRGQFLIIQHRNSGSDAGFESDNNADNNDLMPRSMPTLSNLTMVGGAGSGSPGMVLRRGTHAMIFNAIITGFPGGAVDVRDTGSVAGTVDGTLFLDNSIFFSNGDSNFPEETGDGDNDDGFDESVFFAEEARGNREVDPGLVDATSRTAPNFMPAADGPAAEGAATPPDGDGFFDTSATFVGAIEPGGEDWTAGWTAFPSN